MLAVLTCLISSFAPQANNSRSPTVAAPQTPTLQSEPRPSGSGRPALETLVAEGRDALTAGRYEEAASRFRAALAVRADSPEALFGLGIACSQLGRREEAQQVLRRYVALNPSAADGHSALAMVLLADGKRSLARAEFERTLRLRPDDLDAAKALAHIEVGEYNGARAVALLKPFTSSPEFDDEARHLLAAGYVETGDNQAAASLLSPLLERRPPPPPEVFVLAAGSARRAGDAALGERACTLGLRIYPNSDEIEQRCLRIVSQRFVKDLESGLRGTADDLPVLVLLGRLMTDVAETADAPIRERALQFLEKAVALNPSDASAQYNLGRCLRVLARPEQALPAFERALASRPNQESQALIYTQIGLARQSLQRDKEAETSFRRALELNRGLPRPLPEPAFDFYTFLTASDRDSDAAAVLDEILLWDPAFLPARMERARRLARSGRLTEAAEQAQLVARNTEQDNAQLLRAAHVLLLQLCTRLGRTEEAARHQAWLADARTARQP